MVLNLNQGRRYYPATAKADGLLAAEDWNQLNKVPSCVAYHSVNQSIANSTTTTPAFDSEFYDTDGFHDLATNNARLIVPAGKDGLYVAVLYVAWANATGMNAQAAILDNAGNTRGAARWISDAAAGLTANQQSVTTPPLRLVAGNYVVPSIAQISGGAVNLTGGTGGSLFALWRVGGY